MRIVHNLGKAIAVGLIVAGGFAVVTTFFAPDAGFAASENGKAKGKAKKVSASAKSNNGRGAIASELKWMNSAHASLNGRTNSSENSRHGQLREYGTTLEEMELAAAEADAAEHEMNRLLELSGEGNEEALLAEFGVETDEIDPDTGDYVVVLDEEAYANAVAGATTAYGEASQAETDAQMDLDTVMAALGIDILSPEAKAELHRLLGL